MSKSLVLKVVSSDMKSYGGFQWPGVGAVAVADDWDEEPTCGGGLHGWLNGVGDASCQSWSKSPDAKWLVLSVDTETLVDLGGKVKFPKAEVVHVGDKKSAGDVILATGFIGPVIGATVTGGDYATVTGGYGATVTGRDYATVTGGRRATVTGGYGATVTGRDYATVTGGYGATVTGGYGATVTGGDNATVTGGDNATVTGGNYATVTGGDYATVTGGRRATVTGGDNATVTGRDYATVTGGYGATVTGGYGATVTGGDNATVTGGDNATLLLSFYNGRKRVVTAYVGENGIKPNTPYRLNEVHEFEEVKNAEKRPS